MTDSSDAATISAPSGGAVEASLAAQAADKDAEADADRARAWRLIVLRDLL